VQEQEVEMSTYREIVHMVLDEMKLASDDAYFTEQHIIFLLGKYRAFMLKKEYGDATNSFGRQSIAARKYVPEANYQTLCLDLETVDAFPGLCEAGKMVRSKEKVPAVLNIGIKSVYPYDYFAGGVTYVERERMRYVGHDRWRANVIYATIGPDMHLWFKSHNPQYLYLKKARFTAVFEDADKAAEFSCDGDVCDILDTDFPLEEALISTVIQLVVSEMTKPMYAPEDIVNNSADDSANMRNGVAATTNKRKATDGDDDD
jgi:hypothetical protein